MKKNCTYRKHNGVQRFLIIMSLLGMGVVFTWLFGIIWYTGERLEILPYFEVNMSFFDALDLDLTEGEKWLIFVEGMIIVPFLFFVLIYVGYRYYRRKHCQLIPAPGLDLDDSIELLTT